MIFSRGEGGEGGGGGLKIDISLSETKSVNHALKSLKLINDYY